MPIVFPPAFHQTLQRVQHLTHHHRRGIVGAAVVALLGSTVTAVAIAPLAPDAALLPQRLVAETLEPVGLDDQLQALSALDFQLVRNDITRGSDTPETLLARLGVSDPTAAAFLRNDATARTLLQGRSGRMVQAQTDAYGQLTELVARYPTGRPEQARTHFTRMTISRIDGRWLARLETAALETTARLASGTVQSSLFAATDAAGIPDAVAVQIADMFAVEIDFHRDLRRGDTFSVVYEALAADGEPVAWNEGSGRVLAAEFENAGRTHQAVWFAQDDGRGAYYAPDGSSRKRTFLASPMEFSRISSGFAMRLHPIHRTWRRHLGVDYAAPTGTTVRTVGDGTVSFAGWQNGYGNVVQVQHGGDRLTLYAHLSRIDVRRGQRVEQGDRIGAVGMTGWATGPHLHFEFRVRGQHQDPLRIARAAETIPLPAAARPAFAQAAEVMQGKLQVAQSLAGVAQRAE
jgi:murein DD-endopeptidase MepM/ murein hydrolase activator NlpD